MSMARESDDPEMMRALLLRQGCEPGGFASRPLARPQTAQSCGLRRRAAWIGCPGRRSCVTYPIGKKWIFGRLFTSISGKNFLTKR